MKKRKRSILSASTPSGVVGTKNKLYTTTTIKRRPGNILSDSSGGPKVPATRRGGGV
jgi:hypothetical protein